MAQSSTQHSEDCSASSTVSSPITVQLIRISISDLNQLLKECSMTMGMLVFKVALTRLICNIDDCTWQSSSITDLDSHIQSSHSETNRNTERKMRQIVFSESELQKLAVQGTAVIEGNTFEIVQPVRFLYSIHGGRWYSEDRERIYDTESQLSAKEIHLWEELQEIKDEHVQELTKKYEITRAQQQINKSAQRRIEQLEQDIAEKEAASENVHMNCSASGILGREESSQNLVTSDTCETNDMVKAGVVFSIDSQKKVSQEFADIMKGVMEHWGEEHANQKEIIQTQSDRIASQMQQAAIQKEWSCNQKSIIEAILPVYQRFFVRAEKGCPRSGMTDYTREARHTLTISKGNDAAHRANFIAHWCLWKGKHLNDVDTSTFEKIYHFHPSKYRSMLQHANLVEMYDMTETLAALPHRLKSRNDAYAAKYKDFMTCADATAKIRDTFDKEVGKETEASTKCGLDPDLHEKLQKMRDIYTQFLQYDKIDRENH